MNEKTTKKGITPMSREEATDTLIDWMRQDSERLNDRLDQTDRAWRKKLDEMAAKNEAAHEKLRGQISDVIDDISTIKVDAGISKTKIIGLTLIVSVFGSGIVSVAVAHLTG